MMGKTKKKKETHTKNQFKNREKKTQQKIYVRLKSFPRHIHSFLFEQIICTNFSLLFYFFSLHQNIFDHVFINKTM